MPGIRPNTHTPHPLLGKCAYEYSFFVRFYPIVFRGSCREILYLDLDIGKEEATGVSRSRFVKCNPALGTVRAKYTSHTTAQTALLLVGGPEVYGRAL